MKKIRLFLIPSLIFLALVFLALPSRAIECEGDPPSGDVDQLLEYQSKCEAQISSLQSQQKTLKSAITLLNSQINLTQAQIQTTNAQIDQLEKDISTLGNVITDLNQNLDELTTIFLSRVRESYKDKETDPLVLFLASDDYKTFQNKVQYLRIAQKRDQAVITELESARLDLDHQKTQKQEKQAEVEALSLRLQDQQKKLATQQQEKQLLLNETKNSESVYQSRLAKAVAELRAIESIIAGQGSEVEVGSVSPGEKIATIISGASACSTGTHLHFEVVKSQAHQNPANYLKPTDIIWNNDPDGPFSFSGSWDWPLNSPIRITQGYGHTAYSSRYANDQHTGIDMVSTSNLEVKAVRDGKLYRGSIPCGGGTLKYVHVSHSGDDLDTYYLHVNYF